MASISAASGSGSSGSIPDTLSGRSGNIVGGAADDATMARSHDKESMKRAENDDDGDEEEVWYNANSMESIADTTSSILTGCVDSLASKSSPSKVQPSEVLPSHTQITVTPRTTPMHSDTTLHVDEYPYIPATVPVSEDRRHHHPNRMPSSSNNDLSHEHRQVQVLMSQASAPHSPTHPSLAFPPPPPRQSPSQRHYPPTRTPQQPLHPQNQQHRQRSRQHGRYGQPEPPYTQPHDASHSSTSTGTSHTTAVWTPSPDEHYEYQHQPHHGYFQYPPRMIPFSDSAELDPEDSASPARHAPPSPELVYRKRVSATHSNRRRASGHRIPSQYDNQFPSRQTRQQLLLPAQLPRQHHSHSGGDDGYDYDDDGGDDAYDEYSDDIYETQSLRGHRSSRMGYASDTVVTHHRLQAPRSMEYLPNNEHRRANPVGRPRSSNRSYRHSLRQDEMYHNHQNPTSPTPPALSPVRQQQPMPAPPALQDTWMLLERSPNPIFHTSTSASIMASQQPLQQPLQPLAPPSSLDHDGASMEPIPPSRASTTDSNRSDPSPNSQLYPPPPIIPSLPLRSSLVPPPFTQPNFSTTTTSNTVWVAQGDDGRWRWKDASTLTSPLFSSTSLPPPPPETARFTPPVVHRTIISPTNSRLSGARRESLSSGSVLSKTSSRLSAGPSASVRGGGDALETWRLNTATLAAGAIIEEAGSRVGSMLRQESRPSDSDDDDAVAVAGGVNDDGFAADEEGKAVRHNRGRRRTLGTLELLARLTRRWTYRFLQASLYGTLVLVAVAIKNPVWTQNVMKRVLGEAAWTSVSGLVLVIVREWKELVREVVAAARGGEEGSMAVEAATARVTGWAMVWRVWLERQMARLGNVIVASLMRQGELGTRPFVELIEGVPSVPAAVSSEALVDVAAASSSIPSSAGTAALEEAASSLTALTTLPSEYSKTAVISSGAEATAAAASENTAVTATLVADSPSITAEGVVKELVASSDRAIGNGGGGGGGVTGVMNAAVNTVAASLDSAKQAFGRLASASTSLPSLIRGTFWWEKGKYS